MTLLEMRDKRALFIEDMASLTAKAKSDNRELNEDEQRQFNTLKEKAEDFEKAILVEEEKRKFDPASILIKKTEKKQPSLFKTIRSIVDGRGVPSDYADVTAEAEQEMRDANISARTTPGHIVIPSARSVVLAGQTSGTSGGGYAIATDKPYALPPLTNYLVLTQAGATYMPNLKGFVRIPTYSGTTCYWGSEVEAATNGEGTWGYVDLSPRRLTALIDISKNFLLQDEVGAEALLKDNLAKAIAVEVESTILGVGAGSATGEPTGICYGSAAAYYLADHTATSWSAAVTQMSTLAKDNALQGNLAFITHPYGQAMLMSTAKVSSSDSVMVSDGKNLLGFPLYATSSMAYNVFTTTGSAGLVFGNWSDLLIGQWGGYDLTVDPYSKANTGTVRLVVNMYVDAAVARSASFNVINIT